MTKTNIDYVDYSHNPITGCLRDCEYCYAKGIANRFSHGLNLSHEESGNVLDEPIKRAVEMPGGACQEKTIPFPYKFAPTFHKYRLSDPQRIKKPQTVFVGSMCDLFGDWIPDDWIEDVFAACASAPWHRYLLLTKNGNRYWKLHQQGLLPEQHFYGSTITDINDCAFYDTEGRYNTFLSIEPLLQWSPDSDYKDDMISNMKWVIVGAETGNRKGKVTPKREWIENIVRACCNSRIPLYMKRNLESVWKEPLIQEFPYE